MKLRKLKTRSSNWNSRLKQSINNCLAKIYMKLLATIIIVRNKFKKIGRRKKIKLSTNGIYLYREFCWFPNLLFEIQLFLFISYKNRTLA